MHRIPINHMPVPLHLPQNIRPWTPILPETQAGYTYNTGIILEVEISTVGSLPRLALSYHNGGHNLLSQLGLSLLDGGHDHVANTCSGQTVEAGSDTGDGDDVEVTGARVVAAVHDCTAIREISKSVSDSSNRSSIRHKLKRR